MDGRKNEKNGWMKERMDDLMGWRSNMGGCSSANSMQVMPTAQMSHSWSYPPLFSTAATSGAILERLGVVGLKGVVGFEGVW